MNTFKIDHQSPRKFAVVQLQWRQIRSTGWLRHTQGGNVQGN
jgi:hypothetical protein